LHYFYQAPLLKFLFAVFPAIRIHWLFVGLLFCMDASGLELSVTVEGLERKLKANVRALLSVEQEKNRENLTRGRLEYLHGKAKEEIEQALRPFGYFQPSVEPSLTEKEGRFIARYTIDPGPAVVLQKVDVRLSGEGRDDPLLAYEFPLQVGDDLNQTLYEEAKSSWQSQAVRAGYLDAAYTRHEITVDLDAYSATIHLHMESGIHYRFGELSFIQDVMNPEFLQRYVEFERGDSFSQNKLLGLQSDLIDSDYFSLVDLRVLREQAVDDQVPVEVHLTPHKPNRYRIGLGYSTDIGPRLTLDHWRRRIGRNGKHMRSELSISRPHKRLSTEFIIPLERPTKDYLSFGGSLESKNEESYKSKLLLLNTKHSVSLGGGWRRTLGLDYSRERFEIGEQEDKVIFLTPNISWDYFTSDSGDFPQWGQRFNLRLEGAHDRLLSSSTYLQGVTGYKFIVGFGGGKWRLHNRVELGASRADALTDLPVSKRFFAGGDNSIRGFGLDELGPENDQGEIIGGRYLALGSLELERLLVGKWSAAIFADGGNAFDQDYPSQIEYSAGFGVRWRSPVGPFRFDLAKGLSADHGFRLHIIIGPML
jgi:translocation and assembly module TamA